MKYGGWLEKISNWGWRSDGRNRAWPSWGRGLWNRCCSLLRMMFTIVCDHSQKIFSKYVELMSGYGDSSATLPEPVRYPSMYRSYCTGFLSALCLFQGCIPGVAMPLRISTCLPSRALPPCFLLQRPTRAALLCPWRLGRPCLPAPLQCCAYLSPWLVQQYGMGFPWHCINSKTLPVLISIRSLRLPVHFCAWPRPRLGAPVWGAATII